MRSISKTAAALLLAMAVPKAAAATEREFTGYYVEDFSSAGACTGSSTLTWGYDTVSYLKDATVTWGWSRSSLHGNQSVDFEDIADVDEDGDGADHTTTYGIDDADVGMIYSHGFQAGCASGAPYNGIKMGAHNGNSAAFCHTYYSGVHAGNDVRWGDTDLNMVIIDTCESLQYCNAMAGAYRVEDGNLSMLLGFHGQSGDDSPHTNNFEDYVDTSRFDGAGDNWVDSMTREPIIGEHECATALVLGTSAADADSIYNNAGLEDWKTPGTSGYYYYISGCTATNSPALP